MILDEIKKQNIQAMKDHDQVARSIFSVVMNKAMLEGIKKREKGEELVDADMVAILQKTIKELTEECENFKKVNNQEQIETIERQKEIIYLYFWEQMNQMDIAKSLGISQQTVAGTIKRSIEIMKKHANQ